VLIAVSRMLKNRLGDYYGGSIIGSRAPTSFIKSGIKVRIAQTHSFATYLLFSTFVFITFSSPRVLAEVPESQLQSLLARLPSPLEEQSAGLNINSGNIEDFKDLVPTELIELISSSHSGPEAFRSYRFVGPVIDERWQQESEKLSKTPLTVELLKQSGMPRAFPFGTYDSIRDKPGTKVGEKIQMILTHAIAPMASWGFVESSLKWREVSSEGDALFAGTIKRVVPRRVKAEDVTGQLFRERFSVDSPRAVATLSWLTLRFIDDTEDAVWVYAPAIKRVRSLLETNRADPLFGSLSSLNDFLGFGAKIQRLHGIAMSTATLLMPFASLDAYTAQRDKTECLLVTEEPRTNSSTNVDSSPSHQWNFFNGMAFVPRSVIRLELQNAEPSSSIGRSVMYLDKESFFPHLWIQYKRTGSIEKIVFHVPRMVVSSDKSDRMFLIQRSVIVTPSLATSGVELRYPSIRLCGAVDASVTLSQFDPGTLNPQLTPVVTAISSPTK
jgi:hypothetical protein